MASNVGLVFLAQYDALAPRAPTPQLAGDFALEILHCFLSLVLVELHTFTHTYLLLVLDLQYAANTLNLLRKVARASPALACLWRCVCSGECV